MALKSNKLHFEIHPSRKKPIGYIRNSYREDGKVKHQTISSIHGLSEAQLKSMKDAFDGKSISVSDMKISNGKEYGASATLFALAKLIGLDKTIYSRRETWVNDVLAMIIGRIIYQGSKLSLSRVTKFSHLWSVCGVLENDIDVVTHCYDSMDELLSRQKLIQKKLARKHLKDGSIILYDITSTYFEGEYLECDNVKFGYNRDKKKGKKQIVIALICTKDGCPVAVEVFPGNTADKSTVVGKIDELKKIYGISDFIFVGDRGMLTISNIDARPDTLSVTALTLTAIKKLCTHESIQFSLFDKDTGTEVVLPEEPKIRYILRENPILKLEKRTTRNQLIEKTEELLTQIQVPKKKTDDKTLTKRAVKIFQKYKTEKYFNWDIVDTKIRFSRNHATIAECEQYDGLYVIRSNVSKELMNTLEVVEAYKSLINIEMAFRNMKTVQLEIRPVYHRTEDRILVHVFVCMLAYYLLWHMNKAMKSLYENKSHGLTQALVLEILKAQQKHDLIIDGVSIKGQTVSEPNELQAEIQRAILGDIITA